MIIDDTGELIVRAPMRISEREINRFIESKQQWITKTQRKVLALNAEYRPLVVEAGETLPFLGNSYTIVFEDVSEIELCDSKLVLPLRTTKDALVSWMKTKAKKVLEERVWHYAQRMNTTYAQVKISGAKSRWGSCSAKNNLNFTWRLIMCPLEVIDYIVVHELSHVRYKNHGSSFWAQVAAVLPNYKVQRAWLWSHRKLMDLL